MSFTKLADPCETCPYVEDCDHKQMAAAAELPVKHIDIPIEAQEAIDKFKKFVLENITRETGIPVEILTAPPKATPSVYAEPVSLAAKLAKMAEDEINAMLYAQMKLNMLEQKG